MAREIKFQITLPANTAS